jgi:hypothetical protein
MCAGLPAWAGSVRQTNQICSVFNAIHTDCDGLVDRRGRMRVSDDRQTSGVCLLDQQAQRLDRELRSRCPCPGHHAAAAITSPRRPVAPPAPHGRRNLVRAADLAAEGRSAHPGW